MEFRRHAHSDIIAYLHILNDQVGVARNAFLAKKAESEHFDSKLAESSPGKSNAERTTRAKATKQYLEFHLDLARLESVLKFLEMKFKIMEKEYQSQYQETGLNEGLIRKEE